MAGAEVMIIGDLEVLIVGDLERVMVVVDMIVEETVAKIGKKKMLVGGRRIVVGERSQLHCFDVIPFYTTCGVKETSIQFY